MEVEILRDGVPVKPKAPGQPIEFYGSDVIRATFTNEEMARLLQLPAGYVIVKLADYDKVRACGERPERAKGDLGHAFGEPSPVTLVPGSGSEGLGYATLIRECRDCGFAYGRAVL